MDVVKELEVVERADDGDDDDDEEEEEEGKEEVSAAEEVCWLLDAQKENWQKTYKRK